LLPQIARAAKQKSTSTPALRQLHDQLKIKTIALGSDRAQRLWPRALVSLAWRRLIRRGQNQIGGAPVEISAPAMPLTDEELMRGARERRWLFVSC